MTDSLGTLDPLVIPRSKHTLSRKDIDPDALKVLYRLQRHGYLAYLVGGSVRDLLLKRKPKDFDVGTNANPNQIRRLFRNSRIIGRRFRLVQLFFQPGKVVEVSTFRKLDEADPETEFDQIKILQESNNFGTPAEDALRRDLTINALFYNIADFSIVDYVGGLQDLKNGCIRIVGDPYLRCRQDPVRILRAIRHAARTGFTLEAQTAQAVTELRESLGICPTSRIRDEVMRDLKGGSAAQWLELAHETKVLYTLFPALAEIYGHPESPRREEARTLLAGVDHRVQNAELDDALAIAAVLWPAFDQAADEQNFAEGRAGRVQWSNFVRQEMNRLAESVAFARKTMERLWQLASLMWFLRMDGSVRLPQKTTQRAYFADACLLGAWLGGDLAGIACPENKPKRRASRRRARRKKHSQHKAQTAHTTSPEIAQASAS